MNWKLECFLRFVVNSNCDLQAHCRLGHFSSSGSPSPRPLFPERRLCSIQWSMTIVSLGTEA